MHVLSHKKYIEVSINLKLSMYIKNEKNCK